MQYVIDVSVTPNFVVLMMSDMKIFRVEIQRLGLPSMQPQLLDHCVLDGGRSIRLGGVAFTPEDLVDRAATKYMSRLLRTDTDRCRFDECDRKRYARGWCAGHFRQVVTLRRQPRPLRPAAPLEERLWRNVRKKGDCWLWVASCFVSGGYGPIERPLLART